MVRDRLIDLHVHSTATDGRKPARDVLAEAGRAGVEVLVFADHSAVTFDEELAAFAATCGVDLPFPGIEISTHHEGRRHHVLGYGHAVLDPDFRAYVAFPNRAKEERAARICAALVADGYELPSVDAIRVGRGRDGTVRRPDGAYLTRTAISWALADRNRLEPDRAYEIVRSASAAIDAEREQAPLANTYLPTTDVLVEAARHGVVTALAHPLWRCRPGSTTVDDVVADLEAFAELGLFGVETSSYHHRSLDEHPALLDACRRLGLTRTGGSDYHANGKVELGADGPAAEEYAALLDALARSRAHALASE